MLVSIYLIQLQSPKFSKYCCCICTGVKLKSQSVGASTCNVGFELSCTVSVEVCSSIVLKIRLPHMTQFYYYYWFNRYIQYSGKIMYLKCTYMQSFSLSKLILAIQYSLPCDFLFHFKE